VFLLRRDQIHPDIDAADADALELSDAEYRPSKWLTGN
jgi:hypothetical protein